MKHTVLFFVLLVWNLKIYSQQNSLPSSGNIGVNTTTPSQALEVNGVGLYTGNLLSNITQTGIYVLNGRVVSLSSGGNANSLSLEGQQISFYTGASYSEKMRLTAAGKLGLGPIEPLDKIHLYTGPSAAYGTSGGITISDSYTVARFWDSGGGHDIGTLDLSYDGLQNVRLIANGDSYINGGNVGVGKTNPSTRLDVNGSIQTSGQFILDNSTGNDIINKSATGNLRLGWGTYGISGGAVFGTDGDQPLIFATAYAEKMRLNASGNLGIGTSQPSEKLSVNGNVRAKKVIVSQSGWPDYVFDSSYSLRSLSEVETFIAKNKHLPDMPSAKEVEVKGVSVGDNQALLLKKIEELTLYLIEQDKKINYLLKENKKLKAHEK